jgi:hypothetical protein
MPSSQNFNTQIQKLSIRFVKILILTPHLLHGAETFLGANWYSAMQQIPCILWKLKVHYRIHKCLPPVPILNQLNPDHASISLFLKIGKPSINVYQEETGY